ncbi:Hemolysin, contains CBS domains [Flexibacter flexilis DSM 6793]|uniref:Hemolysin, contains CBS domains n=1 Tax=Flexibacter flexilis DSM 6793 TaxID=927664 RepID=A0A1I1H5T5_9BACT|nr:hemolysin family protein [Flexibacter flexilis]SFC18932.1 Hemolysin, contains CBS domains [Flexibacter flexilis DSM 6793]
MVLDIIFTLFLVFLNGFFVAAEFAIVKVRASQVELMAKTGSSAALMSKQILSHLDAYLSATQLGITLASLALGWIGESVVAEMVLNIVHLLGLNITDALAHQIAVPIAFAVITILHIVFGELAPKSLAIQRPENITMLVAYPLRGFYIVFKPFIWMLNGLANTVLKIFGITPIHGEENHSPEELRYLVEQGKESGSIETANYEIIRNAFAFSDRMAKQIMVPRMRVVAINAALPDETIIEKMLEEGYSRIPVYRDSLDNIIGILYVKDVLAMMRREEKRPIIELIRPATFIPPYQKITKLLRQFQRDHLHIAIVTDEYGGTEGIITMEDIVEELVGEIQDEYDNETPIIENVGEAIYRILADAAVSDINKHIDRPLSENPEYDTIGGLLTYHFGRLPNVNEKIEVEDYEFVVLKKSKSNIILVQMRDTLPPEDKEE